MGQSASNIASAVGSCGYHFAIELIEEAAKYLNPKLTNKEGWEV